MELPHLLYLLIGVVVAAAVLAALTWNRRRNHALRDRLAEEYERALHGDLRDR
ncbi:MAG TPA: hypothetical protein VI168_07380 [Croceibacterium sp.]